LPAHGQQLASLNGSCASCGEFRVSSRGFRTWPQLVIDQGVGGAREYIPALDIGIDSGHGLLSADDVEECAADSALHTESRQSLGRTGASHIGFGFPNDSRTKPEIDRLPREERTRSTPPDAVAGRGRKNRTRKGWNDRLRQQLAEDVVGRRAIRLPQRIQPWKIRRLGDVHVGRRCGDVLQRRANRWIVLECELEGLLKRECLVNWWRLSRLR